MLEAKNTPVDNDKSPAKLACGRQLWSILPVNPNNLTGKSVDNDEFKHKRWFIKSSKRSIMINILKAWICYTQEKSADV